MKNIHLQKTDKPSRLKQNKITKKISLVNKGIDLTSYTPINIYITSDEEIKEGDWILWEGKVVKAINTLYWDAKKIILTTDQDLINDGIQAIEDEFLEWFVNNPSCEYVEVKRGYLGMGGFVETNEPVSKDKIEYKIIIPKEEPKQETLEEAAHKMLVDYGIKSMGQSIGVLTVKKLMVDMAQWQQERSYSELELFINEVKDKIDSFEYSVNQKSYISEYLDEWFEQFKNKKI